MLINFLHQVLLEVLFIKKVLSCLMDSDGLCHTEIKDDLYMDSYCRMVFTITSHYAHRSKRTQGVLRVKAMKTPAYPEKSPQNGADES